MRPALLQLLAQRDQHAERGYEWFRALGPAQRDGVLDHIERMLAGDDPTAHDVGMLAGVALSDLVLRLEREIDDRASTGPSDPAAA